MSQKINYLLRSALNYFSRVQCPNCNSRHAHQIDQKYLVTRLFECNQCYLQFRHPGDDKFFSEAFYQSDYSQEDGITTDLPNEEELKQMLENDFAGSPKNVEPVIKLWTALYRAIDGLSIVDYGCSWGYMSYQFKKLGVHTQSFEISKPRAHYGNKNLGLEIQSEISKLSGGNDLVYSSHVIEHVPSIPEMVSNAQKLLKEQGLFIAESPNGSGAFRKKHPQAFHLGWGQVHPNSLSDKFYQRLFHQNPYFITSAPFDFTSIARWDGRSQIVDEVSGGQLLIIAKPNVMIS